MVRLITKDPEDEFDRCVDELRELVENQGREIFASNQVIGEAYVAVQHHYGVSKADARASLLDALRSRLISPLNGQPVLDALQEPSGPGLVDRLIAGDYYRSGLETLTLDRRMASLDGVQKL